MPTTFAQRLTEVQNLQKAGLGLVAFTTPDADLVYVKDPDYVAPAETTIEVWNEWAGGAAATAYGV